MPSKCSVLFHRKLGLEACDIAVNRGDRQQLALAPVAQQAIAPRDVAVDGDLVPFFGMADVINRHVVMLAPEEGYRRKSLTLPQHVARRGLSLALGEHPVLDPDMFAPMRVWPTRDIAGGIDAGRAGLKISVDDDPAVEL